MWNIFFIKNVTSFIFAMFNVRYIMIINIANSALVKLWPPVVIVSLIARISSNIFYKSLPRYKLIKRFRFFKWFPTSLQGFSLLRSTSRWRFCWENLWRTLPMISIVIFMSIFLDEHDQFCFISKTTHQIDAVISYRTVVMHWKTGRFIIPCRIKSGEWISCI